MEGRQRVLCDKCIPEWPRGKFSRIVIRPTMLYGSKCLANKVHARRINIAEMGIMRGMYGKTLKDKIKMRKHEGS